MFYYQLQKNCTKLVQVSFNNNYVHSMLTIAKYIFESKTVVNLCLHIVKLLQLCKQNN